MWKVTLLFSRSTLSSKPSKTSHDSLVLKTHPKGKVQGARWSPAVEGRPGVASLRPYREGPRRGRKGPDQGPDHRSPAGPVLSRAAKPHSQAASEVGGDHVGVGGELAGGGGIRTTSATRCRQQHQSPPTAQEAGSEAVPSEGGIWEGRLPFPTCPAGCVTGRTTTPDLAGG